jgi:ribosomal protein S27E
MKFGSSKGGSTGVLVEMQCKTCPQLVVVDSSARAVICSLCTAYLAIGSLSDKKPKQRKGSRLEGGVPGNHRRGSP